MQEAHEPIVTAVQPLKADALNFPIQSLREAIATKADLADAFKTQNSVLKNSLRYFPSATAELRREIAELRNARQESSARRFALEAISTEMVAWRCTSSLRLLAEVEYSGAVPAGGRVVLTSSVLGRAAGRDPGETPGRFLTVVVSVVLVLVCARASAVVLDWVTIGAPGNPADTEVMDCCFELRGTTGFGAVGHVYRIGKFEITNAQYAEFLNAVASAADPNALYNPAMGVFDNIYGKPGGILRTGSAGAYAYEPFPGYASKPVRFVDLYRAARTANWLHNGQPSGAQGPTTTENGAYALLGANPVGITRQPGAPFWVPSEDEWYKAAYYDPGLARYWDWATSSDLPPQAGYPPGGSNSANISTPPRCQPPNPSPCELTDIGSYLSAVSPWGTFDQVGNIHEYTETPSPFDPNHRILRGGPWTQSVIDAAAFGRNRAPGRCDGCWGLGFPGSPEVSRRAPTEATTTAMEQLT